MILDIFQYFLEHFWHFQNVHQISLLTFFDLDILQKIRKHGNLLKACCFFISQNSWSPFFLQFWKRRAPKNPRAISTWKQECFSWYDTNIYYKTPLGILEFGNLEFGIFGNYRTSQILNKKANICSNSGGPKTVGSSERFQ